MPPCVIPETFFCKSIVECTYRSVNLIMNVGTLGKDERGERIKYYKHVVFVIDVDNCEDSTDTLTYLCGSDFAENLITGKPKGVGLQAHEYTYGEEIHFENGLIRTLEHLKEHPETRRAVIPIFKTKHIGGKEVPCMITLVLDIESDEEDEYLNGTVLGRSNEMVIAMKSDLKGYAELIKWCAKYLGIKNGVLLLHDINAHVRINSDMDTVKKILKEGY